MLLVLLILLITLIHQALYTKTIMTYGVVCYVTSQLDIVTSQYDVMTSLDFT